MLQLLKYALHVLLHAVLVNRPPNNAVLVIRLPLHLICSSKHAIQFVQTVITKTNPKDCALAANPLAFSVNH